MLAGSCVGRHLPLRPRGMALLLFVMTLEPRVVIQKSMSLKYEPSSEPPFISADGAPPRHPSETHQMRCETWAILREFAPKGSNARLQREKLEPRFGLLVMACSPSLAARASALSFLLSVDVTIPDHHRANSAHIRQSKPDSGLGVRHFLAESLQTL